MSIGEGKSEIASEEIPMYCCLPFSYAVKYGFITIDYDRNSVEIPITVRSSLSDNENKQLMDKLYKEQISHIAARRDGRDSKIFCGNRKIQKGWMLHDTQLSIIQLNQRLNSKILSL